MADESLHQLWAAVRVDFNEAIKLLPSPPVESEGSSARLTEWLTHNELGLALDELEALGDDNAASSEYWQSLARAAERMGLTEQKGRLENRSI